jgi:tRNA 2-selenouridine synthase
MRRDGGALDAAAALAALDAFDAVIDVRSESEYAEDHVPGAVNCPVLTDAERREVGTLDRQQSPFEARRRGAAYVARNIARHLEARFADAPRDWRPLVYCWRGGQRSAAMVHILSSVGWRAVQLDGGYRAYRRAVIDALELLPASVDFRVICGATGSGKSRLLQHLTAAGAQVLDLEALAAHRGSVLGGLPQQVQPGQKRFESLLWDALRRIDPARPVFVESESRRVGALRLPNALLERMRAAPCIHLEVPLPVRVRLLRDEYSHFERAPDGLLSQLDCLVPLHGHEKIRGWKSLAQSGDWDALVEQLLAEHYDPAYARSMNRNFAQMGAAQLLPIHSDAAADYAAAAARLLAG